MAERQIDKRLFFNPNVDNLGELSAGLEELRKNGGFRDNFSQVAQSYHDMLVVENDQFFNRMLILEQ